MKTGCVSLESFPLRPEPGFNTTRGPLGSLIAMAIVAAVWRAEFHRQIRARNPKPVIVPPVHHHVGALGHMTGSTSDWSTYILMVTMRCSFIFARHMTLRADAITRRAERGTVRIVAIAARDACRKHLALPERQIIVDLLDVAHLAVGIGQVSIHRRDQVRIGKRLPGYPFFRKLRASGMAQAACLDLLAQAERHSIALRHSRLCVRRPRRAGAFVELHDKAFGPVFRLSEGPPAFLLLSPRTVARSRAMTCLAANTDLRPGRCEAIGRGVVVLAHAG